jgi:uncharacterized protein (TIGR02217 family)
MAFHEIRLPDRIRIGMMGGPGFHTEIIEVDSRDEYRNDASGGIPLWEFVVEKVENRSDFDEFNNFFHVVHGMSYGFRFRNPIDYLVTQAVGYVGTGSGTAALTYQLNKGYTYGGITLLRPVRKLVSGTIAVFRDGSPFAASGNWSVVDNTGVMTMTADQTGHTLAWSGEYDTPVRFTSDRYQTKVIKHNGAYEILGLGMRELLRP